jgi:hypothetical protein
MKLDDFFEYVLPEVIGCPDPTLRSAVRMAAIDFCRETLAWTEIQDPTPLVDETSDYDIDTPQGAFAYTVRDVWMNNRRLEPKTMAALAEGLPNWLSAHSNEPVFYNAAAERGTIRIFPIPSNSSGSLVIRAAYVPTLTCTTLPDFLGQRHADVIASGAKSRAMLIPGQVWSNPQLGAYYQTKFDDGITKARIEEAHDRVPGTITVRPRAFGF